MTYMDLGYVYKTKFGNIVLVFLLYSVSSYLFFSGTFFLSGSVLKNYTRHEDETFLLGCIAVIDVHKECHFV